MPTPGDSPARGAGLDTRFRAWAELFRFGFDALIGALSPATYNSATRDVVARQIYFTAWQILPWFAAFIVVLSLVITSILAGTARRFGLYDYALELAVRALVLEAVPLLTAFFVALRTGAAIATEVSLMRIRGELTALERMGIDPMRLELIPRVIGGTVALLALTSVGVVTSLLCAHLVVTGFQPWSAHDAELERVVATVLSPGAMLTLWSKVLIFGLAVTVIPISEAMHAPRRMFHAPIAVLNGMVRLFFALMLVETVALALQYL
jgi:phospholipid/cholesterol/gamma-HCH transport system permease protein